MTSVDSADRGQWRSQGVVLSLWFVAALAVRSFVAWRTAMPDWDGVHFLWLADQAMEGDPGQILRSRFFHPAFPSLLAVTRWLFAPALELTQTFGFAQAVSCVVSSLTVFPLWVLARRVAVEVGLGEQGRWIAHWAVGLFVVGAWFVRFAADGLTESLFHPVVVTAALALFMAASRPSAGERRLVVAGVAGVLVGLAFAVRPEGALLGVVGIITLLAASPGRRLEAASFVLGAVAVFFGLVLLWHGALGVWVLSPKFAFVHAEGIGAGGIGHYLAECLRVPGALLEGVGFVVVPLAVLGGWSAWRRSRWSGRVSRGEAVSDEAVIDGAPRGRLALCLLAILGPLAMQCWVAPGLKAHYRFFSGFGVLVLPLAGAGAIAVLRWGARVRRPSSGVASGAASRSWSWVSVLLALLMVAPDVVRLGKAHRVGRTLERDLGVYLATHRKELSGGQDDGWLFTDMTRVAYHTGLAPNPPRRWADEEVRAALRDDGVRIVALVVGRREWVSEAVLREAGFERLSLPGALGARLSSRPVWVWRRG